MIRACLLASVLLASGCRLSDPFYAAKPLAAPEPPAAEYSLLFLSVRGDPVLFYTPDFYSVWFRRVDPHGRDTPYVGTADDGWFRVFRSRTVKDGDFMILVPPGAYELDTLVDRVLLSSRVWHVTGEAKTASRIEVTRPGIYDVGTLRVVSATWGSPAVLKAEGDAFSADRIALLKEAVRGTSWAKLFDQARDRPRKPKRSLQPGSVAWNEASPR